jgi:hypothetical protein
MSRDTEQPAAWGDIWPSRMRAAFLPIPTRRRTWGSKGHTPSVPYNYKHDHISALTALTVSPKHQHLSLYLRCQPRNFQVIDVSVSDFLRALLRHLPGHISLLWNRGSIHQGRAIEAVQQAHPCLQVEGFPAYARGSTLLSRSRMTLKATRRTASCGTHSISTAARRPTAAGCAVPRRNGARSSWRPSCRLHRESSPP